VFDIAFDAGTISLAFDPLPDGNRAYVLEIREAYRWNAIVRCRIAE
jgi:hypothetical protein